MSKGWTPAPGPRRPVANVLHALRRSFQFRGRASRAEFWWFTLFSTIANIGVAVFDASRLDVIEPFPGYGLPALWEVVKAYPISLAFQFAILPAAVSLMWRRLNDTGWPGVLSVFSHAPAVLILFFPAAVYIEGYRGAIWQPELMGDVPLKIQWQLMKQSFGLPYIILSVANFLGVILSVVAGLRRSRPENSHGPHPYVGRTAEVFR